MKTKQVAFVLSLLVLLLVANSQVFGQRSNAQSRSKGAKTATGRPGSGTRKPAVSDTGKQIKTDSTRRSVFPSPGEIKKKKKPDGTGGEPSPSPSKSPTPTPTPLPKPK